MRRELFFVVSDQDRTIVRVEHGGDRARAYHGFNDDLLAECDGGGYDMIGTVLALALRQRYPEVPEIDGAAGMGAIARHYHEHGIAVRDEQETLWDLPLRKRYP